MMEHSESHSVVSFGPFEVDLRTQELRRQGVVVRLSGQPFQILEMLLSRPGELVTRDELQQQLWPGASVVDCTHGLNAAINKLREALGDSAITPQYVETLPRRGYRFIAEICERSTDQSASVVPVAAIPSSSLIPMAQDELPAVSLKASRRWPMALITSAALVTGILGGIELSSHLRQTRVVQSVAAPPHAPEVAEAQIKKPAAENKALSEAPVRHAPLATRASAQPAVLRSSSRTFRDPTLRTVVSGSGSAAPQFSPDGKHIAFMSNRGGPWQIWVSAMNGANPVQVSTTDSAGTPRWSPDGKQIAFDAPCDQGTCVFVAPIDRSSPARQLEEGRVPSFSRDGKWIYFASDRGDHWQVWKIRARGGNRVQVTRDGGFAALESPDGFLYYTKSDSWQPEIWRVRIAGGEESLASAKIRPSTWSSWTVTNKGVLFSTEANGKAQLSLYERSTGQLHDLLTLPSSPRWMGATADGHRVAANDASESQITLVDNLH
jgi:DNA-binding winged helix-turn-helix (wHTH) protein